MSSPGNAYICYESVSGTLSTPILYSIRRVKFTQDNAAVYEFDRREDAKFGQTGYWQLEIKRQGGAG